MARGPKSPAAGCTAWQISRSSPGGRVYRVADLSLLARRGAVQCGAADRDASGRSRCSGVGLTVSVGGAPGIARARRVAHAMFVRSSLLVEEDRTNIGLNPGSTAVATRRAATARDRACPARRRPDVCSTRVSGPGEDATAVRSSLMAEERRTDITPDPPARPDRPAPRPGPRPVKPRRGRRRAPRASAAAAVAAGATTPRRRRGWPRWQSPTRRFAARAAGARRDRLAAA